MASSACRRRIEDGANDEGSASTVQRPRHETRLARAASFAITVVSGPDSGARVVLDGTRPGRLLVGQSPACDLKLSDREVSRRHVAFDVSGDARLRTTDLGSSNGTWIGRTGVIDAFSEGGEDVRIGGTTLRLERIAEDGPATPTDSLRFGRTLGGSLEMQRLYPLCEKLAASGVAVIIEGETGTGKELLAESLHDANLALPEPFVVSRLRSAVPRQTAEAEIFGAEAGPHAAARPGVFEQADGGTLLFDEIAELAPELQPKLLRVLERLEVRRVGAAKSVSVDVRVLAATRKDLDKEVAAGRFREDLFFRLAVARIELPPVRRREGDVGLLARHFWRQLDTGEPRMAVQSCRRGSRTTSGQATCASSEMPFRASSPSVNSAARSRPPAPADPRVPHPPRHLPAPARPAR